MRNASEVEQQKFARIQDQITDLAEEEERILSLLGSNPETFAAQGSRLQGIQAQMANLYRQINELNPEFYSIQWQYVQQELETFKEVWTLKALMLLLMPWV